MAEKAFSFSGDGQHHHQLRPRHVEHRPHRLARRGPRGLHHGLTELLWAVAVVVSSLAQVCSSYSPIIKHFSFVFTTFIFNLLVGALYTTFEYIKSFKELQCFIVHVYVSLIWSKYDKFYNIYNMTETLGHRIFQLNSSIYIQQKKTHEYLERAEINSIQAIFFELLIVSTINY